MPSRFLSSRKLSSLTLFPSILLSFVFPPSLLFPHFETGSHCITADFELSVFLLLLVSTGLKSGTMTPAILPVLDA